MDNTITIEELREGDAEGIAFFKQRLTDHWRITGDDIQNCYVTPSFQNLGLPFIFIARENGALVGHVMLIIEEEGYLDIKNQPWITALYVKNEFRKRGIGKALVEHAKKITKEHGYDTLYLDTAQARGYYERLGEWELIGTDFWEGGGQEVFIMKCDLRKMSV